MKTIQFKYTDAKGKVTERIVVPIQEPSDTLLALDISEFYSTEQLANFAKEFDLIQTVYLYGLNKLYNDYDLNSRLRSFKPGQMTNKVIDAIRT